MSRLARAALAAAVAAAAAALSVVTASADAAPPEVFGIAPVQVVLNGRPIEMTLTGTGLGSVTQVFVSPVVTNRSFVAVGDSALIVTLPADLAPGDYSIRTVSPTGASDGSTAEFSVVTAPDPAAVAPPAPPQYSFAPYPGDVGRQQAEPQAGVLMPGVSVSRPSPQGPRPLSPFILLPLGIVVGGLGYLLWGRPGRLAAADRQGLLAHLVGRPAQALHIGRVCLQCGRLHFVLLTRRDLWQAGRFCSATCFVAAQEDDSAARAGESTAVVRMREMFVYSELEKSLQEALAGDVATLGHAAATGDPAIAAVLAPGM